MNNDLNPYVQLADAVKLFHAQASAVWQAYQANGPGRVERELFDPVDAAAIKVEELLKGLSADRFESLRAALKTARDLAQRCACRSDGLCFITGEAGLIPRRDLHEAFEKSLHLLHDQAGVLQQEQA